MTDLAFAPTDNLEDLGTTVTKYENNLSAIRILTDESGNEIAMLYL